MERETEENALLLCDAAKKTRDVAVKAHRVNDTSDPYPILPSGEKKGREKKREGGRNELKTGNRVKQVVGSRKERVTCWEKEDEKEKRRKTEIETGGGAGRKK